LLIGIAAIERVIFDRRLMEMLFSSSRRGEELRGAMSLGWRYFVRKCLPRRA
jgi:hypothetical protein